MVMVAGRSMKKHAGKGKQKKRRSQLKGKENAIQGELDQVAIGTDTERGDSNVRSQDPHHSITNSISTSLKVAEAPLCHPISTSTMGKHTELFHALRLTLVSSTSPPDLTSDSKTETVLFRVDTSEHYIYHTTGSQSALLSIAQEFLNFLCTYYNRSPEAEIILHLYNPNILCQPFAVPVIAVVQSMTLWSKPGEVCGIEVPNILGCGNRIWVEFRPRTEAPHTELGPACEYIGNVTICIGLPTDYQSDICRQTVCRLNIPMQPTPEVFHRGSVPGFPVVDVLNHLQSALRNDRLLIKEQGRLLVRANQELGQKQARYDWEMEPQYAITLRVNTSELTEASALTDMMFHELGEGLKGVDLVAVVVVFFHLSEQRTRKGRKQMVIL
ncbi:hypothetical protein EV426DRAFT_705909 [Tirmania nivea]|nr:hypothetical protein EV426DRAFT_705909 [Tirmania nivea]